MPFTTPAQAANPFSKAPHNARRIGMWSSLLVAATLAACGGGSDDDEQKQLSVSDIQATPLALSQKATFTLTGEALLSGQAQITVKGCSSLEQVDAGTESRQTVACYVTSIDGVTVETKSQQGDLLLSRSFTVPQPQVTLKTTLGDITLDFYPHEAPRTVLNFLGHVNEGFYTNTLFHRVVPNFVAQGGGFVRTTNGLASRKALVSSLPLESNTGLQNTRGTLGMARAIAPDSATSQFFVNLQDNTFLNYANDANPGYAVFAQVKDGMAVVDRMAQQRTGSVQGLDDVPLEDIVLLQAIQTR